MPDIKHTITSIFMVPPLKIGKERLEENNFINAYIKDIKREVQYDNSVYLLFRPKNLKLFNFFLEEEYERTSYLIDDYDYDGGFVVLVYALEPYFDKDWEYVMKGKYSWTSKEFQELFPKVKKIKVNGKHRDEVSLQYKIFKKSEDLKEYWEKKLKFDFTPDMEYWSGFDIEKETLNIDEIKIKLEI